MNEQRLHNPNVNAFYSPTSFQIEKSQAEIYRLRAKLESTQTENENYQDELEKLQSVVNKSYSDKDRFVSDLDKLREELERSQVGHSTRPGAGVILAGIREMRLVYNTG